MVILREWLQQSALNKNATLISLYGNKKYA